MFLMFGKKFEIKTMKYYHDLYLKSDVLSLIIIIVNLFWLHKFTVVLMPKREKKNIVINYIHIIKTAQKKKTMKKPLELKLTS